VGWLIAEDYEEFCIASSGTWPLGCSSRLPWRKATLARQYCRSRCPNHLPDPAGLNSPNAGAPVGVRPSRSNALISAELKLRLRIFESLREIYVAQEEELRKKWRGATTKQDRETAPRANCKAARRMDG